MLSEIKLDRDTQVRASVDEETVRRYYEIMVDEQARDRFPPILMFRDPDGRLWLADGHHRVTAALRRGLNSILAIVRPGMKSDAIWEAIKANGRNGLHLGRADVRQAVTMALETFPNKSTTVIAEAVGCAQSYVVKIKNQVITSDNPMDTEPRMVVGKDGKSYPARHHAKNNKLAKAGALEEQTEEISLQDDSIDETDIWHGIAGSGDVPIARKSEGWNGTPFDTLNEFGKHKPEALVSNITRFFSKDYVSEMIVRLVAETTKLNPTRKIVLAVKKAYMRLFSKLAPDDQRKEFKWIVASMLENNEEETRKLLQSFSRKTDRKTTKTD